MVLTPPNPIDPFDSYCGIIRQDDGPAPGPAARAFTSLEGVSYDRTTDDAMGVIQHPEWTRVPYAWRGHDSTQHEGSRVYAKIVDGFVRLQGIASTDYTTAGALMFTLPDPSMFPDAPVTVPVVLSPQDDQTAATQPS
jgi:hypothetical protein